jgi:hypothetical protein
MAAAAGCPTHMSEMEAASLNDVLSIFFSQMPETGSQMQSFI